MHVKNQYWNELAASFKPSAVVNYGLGMTIPNVGNVPVLYQGELILTTHSALIRANGVHDGVVKRIQLPEFISLMESVMAANLGWATRPIFGHNVGARSYVLGLTSTGRKCADPVPLCQLGNGHCRSIIAKV